MIWFRSANSHTGPQLHRCIRGRTDGSIRLRANLLQKPLALGGASTDEYAPQLIPAAIAAVSAATISATVAASMSTIVIMPAAVAFAEIPVAAIAS